jgi:hypothetical protein
MPIQDLRDHQKRRIGAEIDLKDGRGALARLVSAATRIRTAVRAARTRLPRRWPKTR